MPDSDLAYLAAGFIVVWVALGAYLVRLWAAQRDLTSRLEDAERRLQREGGGNG